MSEKKPTERSMDKAREWLRVMYQLTGPRTIASLATLLDAERVEVATGPAKQPNPIGASSIARIAGNILSGMAAWGELNEKGGMESADEALKLARYIARKAAEPVCPNCGEHGQHEAPTWETGPRYLCVKAADAECYNCEPPKEPKEER